MLSAQLVVLYKNCKPKPNPNLCYWGMYESLGLNEFTKLEMAKVNEGIWNHSDSSCPCLIYKANVHGLLIEANFYMNLIFLKHIKIPWWTLSYPICIHNFTPWDFNDTQAGPLLCWYLSVTYSKIKSYEILFDHKINLGWAIILKFLTEHCNDTDMLHVKFQNILRDEMGVMDENNFARFEVKKSSEGISYIITAPWVILPRNLFNSLRPSEAYMHQQTNHHWFR